MCTNPANQCVRDPPGLASFTFDEAQPTAHAHSPGTRSPTGSAPPKDPRKFRSESGESVRPGPARPRVVHLRRGAADGSRPLTRHAVTYRIGAAEGPPQVLRSGEQEQEEDGDVPEGRSEEHTSE